MRGESKRKGKLREAEGGSGRGGRDCGGYSRMRIKEKNKKQREREEGKSRGGRGNRN